MTQLPLTIAVDHPAFPGHFPSRPIVPGVVLLDESLRAIAALRPDRSAIVEQARIASAKFLSFVEPGEPVRLECESVRTRRLSRADLRWSGARRASRDDRLDRLARRLMAAIWTTQRERGHPAVLRFFTWVALTLGRPIARLLLYPIVLYFVFAGGAARAASRDYLRRVLGREATLRDGYRHVLCFASAVLDRLYLLNGRHHLFSFDVVGSDVMKRAMADPGPDDGRARRGSFVIGAHIGSFEAVRAGGRDEQDLKLSIVMYEDNAQYLNDVFEAINPRVAASIIPLGRVDSMLRVKRALDEGGFVGMLADRTLDEEIGTSAVREAPLLGGTVPIPTGPFRMAAMLRRPVIFIVGLYRGGNRYEVHYEELCDFSRLDDVPAGERAAATSMLIDEAIQCYVGRLEHFCRVAPYNWFNFYDYWGDGARPDSHQHLHRAAHPRRAPAERS